MTTPRVRIGFLGGSAAVLVLILLGCSSEGRDWKGATTEHSIAAYEAYLEKHAGGPHAAEARTALETLAFEAAQTGKTEAGYREYLERFPDGRFAGQAYRELQRMALGWSFEVALVRTADSLGDLYQSWSIVDAERHTGLAVKLRTAGLESATKVGCAELALLVGTPDGPVEARCSGLGLGMFFPGDDPANGAWTFSKPGTSPLLEFAPAPEGGGASRLELFKELWLLYAVPRTAHDFAFTCDGKVVTARTLITE